MDGTTAELLAGMEVIGPDDTVILRSQAELTPKHGAQIREQINYVLGGTRARVLVVGPEFVQRGGGNHAGD